MLLSKIFDNSYKLDASALRALAIKQHILSKHDNISSLRVFEVVEDPDQFIMSFYTDGRYEVHHLKTIDNRIQAGEIIPAEKNRSFAANPRYISTALKLYLNELNKGHAIRVVADKNSGMWPTYQRVIDRMVNKYNYDTEDIDTNYKGVDDGDYIAQVIKPRGKFKETFNNFRLSI
jgi:hypothetical protein